jgi:Putative lumazine-binding
LNGEGTRDRGGASSTFPKTFVFPDQCLFLLSVVGFSLPFNFGDFWQSWHLWQSPCVLPRNDVPVIGLQFVGMRFFHRLPLVLFLAGATAAGFLINSLHAAVPLSAEAAKEEQAVLAPINAMFDGMAKRDAAAIKKPLLPGGGMVLMRDGKPTQMTFEAFADAVGKPGKAQIEERIHDPLVRIDNDLALVWAPFDFLVDGKVDHCGTDLFNLVRADGKWLIASVADTGRKDCAGK